MNCPKCNAPLDGVDGFCSHCGAFFSQEVALQPTIDDDPSIFVEPTPVHSPSSNSTLLTAPPQIKKWNWGAFSFNAMWGIGNHCYLPLLCLIPIFNLIWMFVCGAKGNEWAWKSGKFNNVEDFIATQETWNRAGLAFFIINLIIIVIYILVGIAIFSANFASNF